MMVAIVLLLAFIILMLASLPMWPYSRSWGYAPSGTMGFLVAILAVLMVLGFLPVSS